MMRALRPGHAAALAALVAVLVFLPALRNGFAYDDVAVIERNPAIHDFELRALLGGGYWADPELGLWRPLTTLSFAADWQLGGGSATWFHAMNLAWHALATALVVLLLARLLPAAAALVGGLVFAVHPVHVEAVANVVGRAELLAACALLAAALLWLRERLSAAAVAGCALLFAIGLAAKESAIMLPALLVLVDAATGRLRPARWREWFRERTPALAVLLLIAAGYVVARVAILGSATPTRIDPALELARTGLPRILTALQAWPHHLRLLLFPRTLLPEYGPGIILPATSLTASAAAGFVILSACIAGGITAWLRGHGRTALVLLWVPVALLPVSNFFVPVGVIVAERLLYLPSLAVALAAGLLATTLHHQRLRAPAFALLAAAVGLGALRTWTHTPVWASTDAVFAALLEERPDSFRGWWHFARTLRMRGQHEHALTAYRNAVGLWPFRKGLTTEATAYEIEQGQLDHAVPLARFAAERWPADLSAQRLLALAALGAGDTAGARVALRAGLALDSTDVLLRDLAAATGTPISRVGEWKQP